MLKWDEVMAAVQHDKQRLMRMHCHVDFDRLDSMGHTLLSELIKPRHCVAVVDAFVLDLVLLYNNPKQVSCWSASWLCCCSCSDAWAVACSVHTGGGSHAHWCCYVIINRAGAGSACQASSKQALHHETDLQVTDTWSDTRPCRGLMSAARYSQSCLLCQRTSSRAE